MRHVTEEGINLIKRFEGFSSSVYICPAGYPTIGYGHVVRDDGVQFSDGIDKNAAEELLRQDVLWAERGVIKLINVPLTDGQFDSLVSFTFNLGSGALQRSTLRRKVNREEHGDVPAQLKRWVWAGGRKFKGLIIRRNMEALFYSDEGYCRN